MIGLGVGASAIGPSFSFARLSGDDEATSQSATARLAARNAELTVPSTAAPAQTIPTPPPTSDPAPLEVTEPKPDWTPTAIRVPKIEVDAPIDRMGVDANNALEVPKDPTRVGWWSGGAEPGEVDPAVLVGHLDNSTGPAVFFRLEKLEAGDDIEVDRADGSTAKFQVQSLESHPKTQFPTDAVYGHTEWPSLRLITCFGEFDPVARSYENNLVIYATLVG